MRAVLAAAVGDSSSWTVCRETTTPKKPSRHFASAWWNVQGRFQGHAVAAACSAGQVPGDAGQVRGRVDRGREEHFLEKTFQNPFSVPVVSVNEGGGERLKILNEGDDDEEDGPSIAITHGCDHSDALGGHLAPQSWDEGMLSFR